MKKCVSVLLTKRRFSPQSAEKDNLKKNPHIIILSVQWRLPQGCGIDVLNYFILFVYIFTVFPSFCFVWHGPSLVSLIWMNTTQNINIISFNVADQIYNFLFLICTYEKQPELQRDNVWIHVFMWTFSLAPYSLFSCNNENHSQRLNSRIWSCDLQHISMR